MGKQPARFCRKTAGRHFFYVFFFVLITVFYVIKAVITLLFYPFVPVDKNRNESLSIHEQYSCVQVSGGGEGRGCLRLASVGT